MNKKILFLLFIFSVSTVFSQEDMSQKKNTLEFSSGYTFGSLKNLELAPVARYDYSGIIYNLSYRRRSKKQNIFEVSLDFLDKTSLETERLPIFNTEILKGGINVSYLKQLYTKHALTIHLGLQSQSVISAFSRNNNYFDLHQKFSIASRFVYQLSEKHYLSSQISIPFVLGRVTTNRANLYSFNRYQSILWNLKYDYHLSDNFALKTSYEFNYNRLQIPIAYREVQHQLNLGIIYKF